jgi:hypothetical protein
MLARIPEGRLSGLVGGRFKPTPAEKVRLAKVLRRAPADLFPPDAPLDDRILDERDLDMSTRQATR